ncbi:MAG: ABC transporter ATP-binding protein [Acidimicrobiaceae bacterium]|nr:ABC transporter ATP-binding protein [Acidimicrobiaceae bacterium]
MTSISFSGVGKVYGDRTRAVTNLNLEIADGELMVLVGPSGCGKTTALRMVAGLEEISEGTIRIGDLVVNNLDPGERDVAMVFQNYALYPHMSVFDNMAFPLQARRVPRGEVRQRVEETAAVLGLTELLSRRPRTLSGGQRQRVAMGRAIVRAPRVFLMDEPLSNLDAKLRVQMRSEISRIQSDLGVTTIYVTHDQVEAMTMGTRIAIMRRGVLQQVGSPREVYNLPDNLFVATFIGSPSMNLLRATLCSEGDELVLRLRHQRMLLPRSLLAKRPRLAGYRDAEVAVGLRPEDLTLQAGEGHLALHAKVARCEMLGPEQLVHASVDAPPVVTEETVEAAEDASDGSGAPGDEASDGGGRAALIASVDPSFPVGAGDTVPLGLNPDRLHFFDLETGAAIRA